MDKIVGSKVYLRPITLDDTDLIVKWRNSELIQKHFIFREKFTREMHTNWVNTKVATGKVVQYIICTNDGNPIGSIYYRDVDCNRKEAEFGIFIGEENAVGKGYGSEATSLFVKFGFDQLNFNRITLRVIDSNERALHVYQKIGFKKICEKVEISQPSGNELNVVLMEICKS